MFKMNKWMNMGSKYWLEKDFFHCGDRDSEAVDAEGFTICLKSHEESLEFRGLITRQNERNLLGLISNHADQGNFRRYNITQLIHITRWRFYNG